MVDKYTLQLRQALPLEEKIKLTNLRIRQWIDHFGVDGCYVSFSGGKDSTVLLDLVRKIEPNIEAVFVDTGLEYPEIRQFVKTKENVTILRPKMRFDEVIEKYGYPIISKEQSQYIYEYRTTKSKKLRDFRLNGNKYGLARIRDKWKYLLDAPFKISHKCCYALKKSVGHRFYKKNKKTPFIGTMAEESSARMVKYLQQGCNGFNLKIPTSTPLAFWTEQDILKYLYDTKLPYASVYGDIVYEDGKYHTTGCQRTGCMFCGFGCHLEKEPNRFQRLKETHPKQYDYVINTLGFGEVLKFIGVKY